MTGKVSSPEALVRGAIGDGLRRVDAHDVPGAKRLAAVVAGGGLGAKQLALGRELARDDGTPARHVPSARLDSVAAPLARHSRQLHASRTISEADVVPQRSSEWGSGLGRATLRGFPWVGSASAESRSCNPTRLTSHRVRLISAMSSACD
jgi:hypothetical protein